MNNIIDILIEKIISLSESCISANPAKLFEDACEELNIEFTAFYKEDINNLALYSCQIILNNEIFLNTVSGNSATKAYESAIRKFINKGFIERNIPFQFPEFNPDDFYTELKESIDGIDLSHNLSETFVKYCQELLQTAHLSKINSINYEHMKTKLAESGSSLVVSEKFRTMSDGSVLCSIFLNEKYLLIHSTGRDNRDALENTVSEFFTAYQIMPKEHLDIQNGVLDKDELLFQLGKTFKEKMESCKEPLNYWDIIESCTKEHNFTMIVSNGTVKINGINVVEISDSFEYVANIIAGRKLVEILSKTPRKAQSFSEPHQKQPATTLMNFPKNTKTYNEEEREEMIKTVVTNILKEYQKDTRQTYWNLLNREFLKQNFKVEPQYGNKNLEKNCTLTFQGLEIISGTGIDKPSCREAASKNLVDKYSSAS